MRKLHLASNGWYSKPFELKKLNVLFSFQVNCPGCFAYGIPFVNGLQKEFGDHIGILGLSTAFENFDLNTLENTKKLVAENTLVGHTKEVFEKEGYNEYPYTIDFPVTFDVFADVDYDYEKATQFMVQQSDVYLESSEDHKTLIKNNVIQFLKKQEVIAETFTLNQFRGTPSFSIFDDDYSLIASYFGHDKRQKIVDVLLDYIKK